MSILTLGLLLLAADPCAAPAAPAAIHVRQDAATRLQALLAEYSKSQSEFFARLQKIGDQAEVQRVLEKENPLPAFVGRFRELAFETAGTETGVGAWIQVVDLGLEHQHIGEAREALDVLLGDHLESPQWADLATNLRYSGARFGDATARNALTKVMQGSPHAPVRVSAQFALASILMESDAVEDKAAGRKLFEEIPTKYADVEGGWGERAKGMLFELDHLQVGMLAPDFEAVDADGAKWKLSDYRGKVVVVDFWGFW